MGQRDASQRPAEEPRGALDPAQAKESRPRRRRKSRLSMPGAPTGQLVADPDAPRPVLRVLAYGPDGVDERPLKSVDELPALLGKRPVTWVQVTGLGDAAVLEKLGEIFKLHRLALEDVLNTRQRAKFERYEGYDVLFVRMPGTVDGATTTEQLALFFGKGFVLTFDERPGDCFEPIRQRLREGKGRLRAAGPDYLAYALLDAVIDAYFPVVETAGERLDALEEDILAGASPQGLITRIHAVRRDLLVVRRALWPVREVVSALQREEDAAVTSETRLYLRDVYDHVVNLLDVLENLRELAAGLMELHLSAVGNRMNEIMKVLTIISTVFIPLTFIVGVYGMNFDPGAGPLSMPELRTPFGYVTVWAVMIAIVVAMVVFFRRKGWLGSLAAPLPPREGDGR
jgi:magnesium transporter